MRYSPSPVPTQIDLNLLDWLRRELRAVQAGIQGAYTLPVVAQEPQKPQVGTVRYADGSNWDPGNGPGPYYFDGATWKPMFNLP